MDKGWPQAWLGTPATEEGAHGWGSEGEGMTPTRRAHLYVPWAWQRGRRPEGGAGPAWQRQRFWA